MQQCRVICIFYLWTLKAYRNCGKRETEMMTMPDADSTSDSEENEDELSKPKSQTSRGTNLLLKWEDGKKISGPFLHNSPPTPPSNSAWSMVLIKDNHQEDCSSLIFPPIHHENLHLTPQDHHRHDDGKPLTLPPPSSSFSSYSSSSAASLSEICEDESNDTSTTLFSPSSDSNPPALGLDSPVFTPTPKVRNAADVASWVNFGLDLLYSKVRWIFGSVHFPVKVSALTTAAMLVGVLYFRWRRKRVMVAAEDGRDRLARIIREKDERINQLLNQIARLNDVLLALQRVPSSNT